MFRIIFLALMICGVSAGSQSSQGHIKYSDGNGINVDWKLYAPYSQVKSQLRRESEKTMPERLRTVQTPARTVTEPRYKPFSEVPYHLKQLLTQSYESQVPYVDPDAFFYKLPVSSEEPAALPQFSAPSKSKFMDYEVQTQSTVVRPREQQQRREQKQRLRVKEEDFQPERSLASIAPVHRERITFDNSVPLQIQRLIQFQAQIPYNVIANHIVYKPDAPFVPEPLPDDQVGPYKYRSRVYYASRGNGKIGKTQDGQEAVEDDRSRE